MSFETVLGQQQAQALFEQMITSGRLPHAMLLLGSPGNGSLALALALARRLLCTNPTGLQACENCKHCHKSGKLIHPDLHFSFPTVGSKVVSDHLLPQWREALVANPYMEINDWLQHIGAENKQGNLNKDECLNITRKLSLKSFESERKIMILWLPEYLGNEGNRLLKLIEEPPENTVFILVSENSERILNTILSRCQLVKTRHLSDEEVTQGLVEKLGLTTEQAQSVAQLAAGNFNDAQKLAAQQESDQAVQFLNWMRVCYKGLPVEMVEWVNGFAGLGRENQKHFLRYALHFWRELLVLKTFGKDTVRLREREKNTAAGMAKVVNLEQLEAIVNLIDETSYHIERNAHPKVLFLDTSIQINHIIKRWEIWQTQQPTAARRRAS